MKPGGNFQARPRAHPPCLRLDAHGEGIGQVEHRADRRRKGQGEGAVCAPALRMLAMRAIGRGGDGVAHTPALTVHDRVQVPHGIHLLSNNTTHLRTLENSQHSGEHQLRLLYFHSRLVGRDS